MVRESGDSMARMEQAGNGRLDRQAELSVIFDDIYRNRGAQTTTVSRA
jgi:hypothetical protein